MKRITAIQLQNYRAFYGQYAPIELPNGQNLLIYGENGSGKSSLFKALSNFFSSSRNSTLNFTTNHHNPNPDGEIKFTFCDFDSTTNNIIEGTDTDLIFSTANSNNNVQFVKDTDLIKGFLDYRSLLDVYNHKQAQPNLFTLIVNDLLYERIPRRGGTEGLGGRFNRIISQMQGAYNRRVREHQNGLRELPQFENALRETLQHIFRRLNYFLIKYFKLNLRVGFNLSPITFNYTGWKPNTNLRLELKLNGVLINDHRDFLNEARLSALAICLYLASLKQNPQSFDYKILFLDDVFVGLDAGNRIPILNILKNEFADYQIFISTYDRHWFEIAKSQFNMQSPSQWLFYEFYVGTENNGTREFDVPIMVEGATNYEKGVQYLHNRERPDYPAAANYFRKALEDVVQKIPKYETTNAANTQIPDFKLIPLTEKARNFLFKTNNPTQYIDKIIPLIPALLHPLSHHEITAPVYKNELLTIETYLPKLKHQLEDLEIENNFKCLLERDKMFRIKFDINAQQNEYGYYDIKIIEPLIKIKKTPYCDISKTKCKAIKCSILKNSSVISSNNLPAKNPSFNYTSLFDAYEKIFDHLQTQPQFATLVKASNYIEAIEVYKENSWQPLSTELMVW